MENQYLEIKLKKYYNSSSFIFLLAYILYSIARRFDGYFWLNHLALSLVIINFILMFSTLLVVYKNKIAIKNIRKYYLKIALGLLFTIILGVLIVTLY